MEISRPIPGWRPSTPDVRGDAIADLLQQHSAIAIHFWAVWNGVDPPMDRSIQDIADRFAGRVWFVSCNVDLEENVELCRRFGVATVPTLGILVPDRQPQLLVGHRPPEQLAAEIETRLNEPERQPWWASWRS
jgi:thioredoxin-like negative regulator of GroEL